MSCALRQLNLSGLLPRQQIVRVPKVDIEGNDLGLLCRVEFYFPQLNNAYRHSLADLH